MIKKDVFPKENLNSNIKKNYTGDTSLLSKLYYSKNDDCECVYCGNIASTREHIPPKFVFSKPYPENLTILPACNRCNNSFSKFEKRVSLLLKWINFNFYDVDYSNIEQSKFKHLNDAYSGKKPYNFEPTEDDINAIYQVATKLLIGHTMYDGSSYITGKECDINFTFAFQCPNEWNDIFNPNSIFIQNKIGEIGSRDAYVIQSVISDESQLVKLWQSVQENNYRYMLNWGEFLLIAIKELLFIKIDFNAQSSL